MSNVPANQHYIWQHYLRAWCTSKKIWCKRTDCPEPFEANPRNVGAERFFYEAHELSHEDVTYLETVVSWSNDEALQELNRGWIKLFQMSFKIRKLLSNSLDPERRSELHVELGKIEKTLGERLHGGTEMRAVPILNALREEDVSFYSAEEARTTFIDYISHQYFRTAKRRNAVLAIPNPLPHDANRTWPIEAFIYATNVAASFVRMQRNYRIVLLRNRSEIPFVTGDQPVINLCGVDVEEVDLYYPLKPDLAMIFTADRTRYSGEYADVGRITVEAYNHHIFAESDNQIYGNDPSYLKALAQMPKRQIV